MNWNLDLSILGQVFGTEAALRIGAFVGCFALLAAWEVAAPCRALVVGRGRRWPHNLALVVIDTLAVRLLIPVAAFGAALFAEQNNIGLLRSLPVSPVVAGVAGFLILDLVIYAQHYFFHHIPWLWRLHRVHHADLDVDVTTGVRFHPIEIIISMLLKMVVVLAFGIPATAVLIFEVVLNATSMFNHANAAMPHWLDRLIRLLVVTPDMHRVHHSIIRAETDSNFGFNLPWWDWIFGTYRPEPGAGRDKMTLGLPVFRDPHELRIDRLLTQPFRNESGARDKSANAGKTLDKTTDAAGEQP